MMFRKIEFYNNENKKIEYIKYIKSENSLIVDRGNGKEKIPADGLRKVIKWRL